LPLLILRLLLPVFHTVIKQKGIHGTAFAFLGTTFADYSADLK
jgi:hypothetical protein